MDMKGETRVSTRTKIDGVEHVSAITIDWAGMSVEDLQALAQRAIVVRKQNADRAAGVIPAAEYVLRAVEYKLGARAPKPSMTPEQVLSGMSEGELLAYLEKRGISV